MKALSLALLLLAPSAHGSFLSLSQDQSSYETGQRALIITQLKGTPERESQGFHLKLKAAGEEIALVRVSDTLAIGFTPRFQKSGEVFLRGEVYLETKATIKRLEKAEAGYRLKVFQLKERLNRERDPEARAELEAQILRHQSTLAAIENQIRAERQFVEVNHSSLSVLPAPLKAHSLIHLTADRDPAVYSVGETATFTATSHSGFQGPDGPMEIHFRGQMEGMPLSGTRINDSTFTFSSPAFSEAGSFSFQASLFLFSKKQGSLLQNMLRLARNRRTELQREKAKASESDHAYYDLKISELNDAIGAIQWRLNEILMPVTIQDLPFTVEAP